MPIESKIVSSQEVALAAGVSRTVVSWVVNGTAAQHRVTQATEQRVKAAVAQLNYEPSRFLAKRELLSCHVDKLLSERPEGSLLSSTTQQLDNPTTSRDSGSLPSATQQPSNLTTFLVAAGYRLMPVENVDELGRMPREGLVGILYRKASSPSATEQPNNLTTAPQAPSVSEVAAGSWEIMKDKV
jgi:hypothetical protein